MILDFSLIVLVQVQSQVTVRLILKRQKSADHRIIFN